MRQKLGWNSGKDFVESDDDVGTCSIFKNINPFIFKYLFLDSFRQLK